MEKNNFSIPHKIGQCFFAAAFVNDTESQIKQIERLITQHWIGGLTFFHSRASAATNFESKTKVISYTDSYSKLKALIQHYQSIAPYPLLMSIDAEWGLAMRIEKQNKYPYALCLGALPQSENVLIENTGYLIGKELRDVGIHINLAPVADINLNPKNPVIGYRSFGDDKHKVFEKSMAFYKGSLAAGVMACFKHFPGHGDTATDSHLALPTVDKFTAQIYAEEFYPFREAIDKGIEMIMAGHIAMPKFHNGADTPSSLSKTLLTQVLREQLHYNGVIISDALNMHSVSKMYEEKGQLEQHAFEAGNDILCFAEHIEEGILAIAKNCSAERIEESFLRVMALKDAYCMQQETPKDTTLSYEKLITALAQKSITCLWQSEENPVNAKGISIGDTSNTHFLEVLKQNRHITSISDSTSFKNSDKALQFLNSSEAVVVAIYPPSEKPAHSFGIADEALQLLELLLEHKKVYVYLFGNPYFLQNLSAINAAKELVVCYEKITTFQEQAALFFSKNISLCGELPVTLNSLKKLQNESI
jgi:beta-glucosidase-like glycosyl hydrolase